MNIKLRHSYIVMLTHCHCYRRLWKKWRQLLLFSNFECESPEHLLLLFFVNHFLCRVFLFSLSLLCSLLLEIYSSVLFVYLFLKQSFNSKLDAVNSVSPVFNISVYCCCSRACWGRKEGFLIVYGRTVVYVHKLADVVLNLTESGVELVYVLTKYQTYACIGWPKKPRPKL